MIKLIFILLTIAICNSPAASEEYSEYDRITQLDAALDHGGVDQLLAIAQRNRWNSPHMYSQWHVEHRITSDNSRKVADAARDFGRRLVDELDKYATSLQILPADNEMSQKVLTLLNLSDWCASTQGYGNIFLAQRCLDLAAVGIAHLTASLEYPASECEILAARLSPDWMSVATRAQILNSEVGATLFPANGSQEDLENIWGSGGFLLRESKAGIQRPQGDLPGQGYFVESELLKANMDFFEDDESVPDYVTLKNTWNSKRFERIVNGLELQNVLKAQALLKFRLEIGYFPERIHFTEEQLQKQQVEIAAYEKQGIKVSGKYEGLPPIKAAFWHAWENRVNRNPSDHNLDALAWRAYDEVKNGQFLDEDSRMAHLAIQKPMP
ncbi:MAG TPA: hypothetical protein PKE26_15460 [Kiritimatiellia bacterium]|nr:hypothetical protein [Saprospiraceae bacterium]HMP00492.1 hypothetical protein [Kiritimatiellia bacterium]